MDQYACIDITVDDCFFNLQEIHIDRPGIRIIKSKKHGIGRIFSGKRHLEIAFELFLLAPDQFGPIPLAKTDSSTQESIIILDERIHSKAYGGDIVGAFDRFYVEGFYI